MGRNVGVVSFLERGEGSNVGNLCERNFLGALALAWEGALPVFFFYKGENATICVF